MNARLLSLETAVPGHRLDTADVVREASAIFGGRHPDFERLLPIYANSGVRSRYSVMDYDWFRAPQGWPERSAAFVDGACAMFRSCAAAALANLKILVSEKLVENGAKAGSHLIKRLQELRELDHVGTVGDVDVERRSGHDRDDAERLGHGVAVDAAADGGGGPFCNRDSDRGIVVWSITVSVGSAD